MKFSPKCRIQNLGMIWSIFGSFAHFEIGKGPIFGPKSSLGKSVSGEQVNSASWTKVKIGSFLHMGFLVW